MKPGPTQGFMKRNIIAVVMVPTLIGLHYGWLKLQDNDLLVAKEEKMDLPIVIASKKMWEKYVNREEPAVDDKLIPGKKL